MKRRAFVQCAEISLVPGADGRAPGGAVTLALCGSWDHAGPCRWPHETRAEWHDRVGKVRVAFLVSEEEEDEVRALIDRALAGGTCVGPDGQRSEWTVAKLEAGVVSESETAWAAALGSAEIED